MNTHTEQKKKNIVKRHEEKKSSERDRAKWGREWEKKSKNKATHE